MSSVFHCLGDLLFLLLRNGTVRCLPSPDLTLVALLDVLLLLPEVDGSLAANTLSGLDKSRWRSHMRCVIGNSRENWISWRSQSWRVRWGAPCSTRCFILCCSRSYLVLSAWRPCRLAALRRLCASHSGVISDEREDLLNGMLNRICKY